MATSSRSNATIWLYYWIYKKKFAVSSTPQKRALNNYRKRLKQRGMARFEVLGLDGDRDLIRSLANRLACADADSARIRATRSAARLWESHRKRAAFLKHYADRRWLAPIWISNAR